MQFQTLHQTLRQTFQEDQSHHIGDLRKLNMNSLLVFIYDFLKGFSSHALTWVKSLKTHMTSLTLCPLELILHISPPEQATECVLCSHNLPMRTKMKTKIFKRIKVTSNDTPSPRNSQSRFHRLWPFSCYFYFSVPHVNLELWDNALKK